MKKELLRQISPVIKILFRIVWNVQLVNAFDLFYILSKLMKHDKILSMHIFFPLPLKKTDVYVNIWKKQS